VIHALARGGMVLLLLCSLAGRMAVGSAFNGNPKLVVILVLDQFRGDYLEKYRDSLNAGGFRLLSDQGAYFPNCYYRDASLMTAPGHASIATGAYTDMHGIAENEWWDPVREPRHPVSSVEDELFQLTGPSGEATPGASPRNLRASTIGDEVRLATQGRSKLFAVSFKDRSAILLSGHSANAAYWIDPSTGSFISSTYYMRQLPEWVVEYNHRAPLLAAADSQFPGTKDFYHQVGATGAGVAYEIAFAEQLIQQEDLGRHGTTDVLTLSISSTDILGHRVGPESEELHALLLAVDRQLAQFFSFIDQHVEGGLGQTLIAMTGDHGVAPEPGHAKGLGLDARRLHLDDLIKAVNANLNALYSRGGRAIYVFPDQALPYLSLSEAAFRRVGLGEGVAEQAVADAITRAIQHNPALYPQVRSRAGTAAKEVPDGFRVFSRDQIANNRIPPTALAPLVQHSYTTEIGWYDLMILDPFATEEDEDLGIHYSPWSYDRHVPLAFYGAAFLPGVYFEQVEPIDLAVTLAAVLHINQPSSAEGSVLHQALRPSP
jgi:hypothetical protein